MAAGDNPVENRTRERIYIEEGSRKVFACSLEWPGWCRAGRDEDAAIATWQRYAERYAVVASEADIPFSASEVGRPEIVERIAGSGSTDFGIPAHVPETDGEPLDEEAATRVVHLLAASWRVFDRVVVESPRQLRRGRRGGGRDRDDIVAHVVDAERGYATYLGVRIPPTELAAPGGVAAMRAAIADVLRASRAGTPPKPKGWPPRYAARRIAWHVLDHAWEIEDKRV